MHKGVIVMHGRKGEDLDITFGAKKNRFQRPTRFLGSKGRMEQNDKEEKRRNRETAKEIHVQPRVTLFRCVVRSICLPSKIIQTAPAFHGDAERE